MYGGLNSGGDFHVEMFLNHMIERAVLFFSSATM